MTEEEVFVRAYCAVLGSLDWKATAVDPDRAKEFATSFAAQAVDAWRHRPTVPGRQLVPRDQEASFFEWRNEVDQEHALDTWTMAFAWLSGRGMRHERALDAANLIEEALRPDS